MRRARSGWPAATVGATAWWQPRHWSFAMKVWILILVGILLGGGAILGISTRITRDRLRTEVQDAFAIAAHSNLSAVSEAMSRAFTVLRGIAADEVVVGIARSGHSASLSAQSGTGTLSELEAIWAMSADDSLLVRSVIDAQLNPAAAQLRRHLAGLPDFVEVSITDQEGIVVAANRRPETLSLAATPWWASAYNQGQGSQYAGLYRRIGEMVDPAGSQRQTFEMVVPIYGNPVNRTDFVGLVYARLNLNYLFGAFSDARPSDEAEVLIINQHGQAVVATQVDLIGSFVDASWWQRPYAEALSRVRAPSSGGHAHEAVGLDGEPVLLGHAAMPYLYIDRAGTYQRSEDIAVLNGLGWILYIYEPQRTAYAAGIWSAATMWGWGGGAILIVLVLSYALARKATSPLEGFLASVRRAIDGQAVLQSRVYAQREISVLGQAFGQLLDTREALQAALVERDEAFTEVHTRRRTEVALLSKVGELVAAATQLDELTQQVVELVRSRYSLYYVGLYVVDNAGTQHRSAGTQHRSAGTRRYTSPEHRSADGDDRSYDEAFSWRSQRQQWAVLRAGTGDQGRLLLAQGHRVPTSSGIVGWCLSSGAVQVMVDGGSQPDALLAVHGSAPVVDSGRGAGGTDSEVVSTPVEDTGTPVEDTGTPVDIAGPRLGDSDRRYVQSEIGAPLRFRGMVTGVLVAQSYDVDTFDEAFGEIFQILADELAVAIESLRLDAERQEADERLQRAYGELTRDAWREMLGQQMGRGYEAAITGAHTLSPLDPQAWQALQQEAWKTGELAVAFVQDESGVPLHRAVLPIRARGEVIGVLDVSRSVPVQITGPVDVNGMDASGRDRAITVEELTELEALTDQLGLALENARLYELARQRAMEEQIVGQVTQRMRETLSVDTVLQTAASELQQLLSLSGVEIRVGTEPVEPDGHHRTGNHHLGAGPLMDQPSGAGELKHD